MSLYGVSQAPSFQDTRGQGGGGVLHTMNMTKIIRTGLQLTGWLL